MMGIQLYMVYQMNEFTVPNSGINDVIPFSNCGVGFQGLNLEHREVKGRFVQLQLDQAQKVL